MGWDGSADYFNQGCLFAEVGGQCVVGLADKELGRLFEEGGQVSDPAMIKNNLHHPKRLAWSL